MMGRMIIRMPHAARGHANRSECIVLPSFLSISHRLRKESPYIATGAAVGLMGDLFRDFQAVLDFGLQFIPDTPQTAMSSR